MKMFKVTHAQHRALVCYSILELDRLTEEKVLSDLDKAERLVDCHLLTSPLGEDGEEQY